MFSEPDEEARRLSYRNGFNDGYRKGYEKGYEEGLEKAKRKNSLANVYFLKIRCECGAINLHPVFESKLVINEDEERRCYACGRIIRRERILSHYSRIQSNNRF